MDQQMSPHDLQTILQGLSADDIALKHGDPSKIFAKLNNCAASTLAQGRNVQESLRLHARMRSAEAEDRADVDRDLAHGDIERVRVSLAVFEMHIHRTADIRCGHGRDGNASA